jgi:hypothetical protein
MPDYFALENYYSSVKPPTRAEQALTQEMEQMNEKARLHNSAKASEKVITGPIKRYCPLDESPLKPIKPKPLEGLPEISKPRYRCVLCKSVFEGYGLDLFHETKRDLKAIAFEYTGNI